MSGTRQTQPNILKMLLLLCSQDGAGSVSGPQSGCKDSPIYVVSAAFAASSPCYQLQELQCQGDVNCTMLTLPAACRLPSLTALCTGPVTPGRCTRQAEIQAQA